MDLISAIIGRNLAGVERLLGPAEREEISIDWKGISSLKAYFFRETISITFIQGVADWIKVVNTDMNFIEEFTNTLGIQLRKPSYVKQQEVVRYYNLHGLKEVAFFKDEKDAISYIIIKAFTE